MPAVRLAALALLLAVAGFSAPIASAGDSLLDLWCYDPVMRPDHALTCAERGVPVLIVVRQTVPIACESSPPTFARIRQPDGSYQVDFTAKVTAGTVCSETSRWLEEWTDLPERGGRFIRVIE